MGVIILAGDDGEFRHGEFVVMRGEITTPPTAPGVTFILHTRKWSEDDTEDWIDLVAHRFVVVLPKKPTLTARTKDRVILHDSFIEATDEIGPAIGAMMRWRNRNAAWPVVQNLPVPVALSVWRNNHPDDIDTARRLARVSFVLPELYAHAVFTFSVNPMKPGKRLKVAKEDDDLPIGFRESDHYAVELVRLAPDVANTVRVQAPETLPKGVKKRQTQVMEWL
jgi:hypothetical protein